jgi:uncharacterized protein YndB with AHSA1/START domain
MKRVPVKMEFISKASPAIIYKFLTAPSCLVRWFCDSVDIMEDEYTFSWEGSEEIAHLVDDYEEERLLFKWENAESDKEFLEFVMYKSEITGETVLEITDFADEGEEQEVRDLWNTQIETMKREAGG